MAEKSEKVGVVVSNKMQKSIVVAVEWQVRHGLYGKTERRTSKFMVHDAKNEAKIGDTVAIVETRPMSRRKRWALVRIVRIRVQEADSDTVDAEAAEDTCSRLDIVLVQCLELVPAEVHPPAHLAHARYGVPLDQVPEHLVLQRPRCVRAGPPLLMENGSMS